MSKPLDRNSRAIGFDEGMQRAANIAVGRAEWHRDHCRTECRCADGWHIADAIRREASDRLNAEVDALIAEGRLPPLPKGAAMTRTREAPAPALPAELSIRFAQQNQPWTVKYSDGVMATHNSKQIPHVLASHAVLHAAKSVGKLAGVFEAADHSGEVSPLAVPTVKAMAADLVTAALRLANLYGFDLATELVERVTEKNGVGFEKAPAPAGAGAGEGWDR